MSTLNRNRHMAAIGWHNNLCSTCGNRYLRMPADHQPKELLSGSYVIRVCNGCSGWTVPPIPIWELGMIDNPEDYDSLANLRQHD